MSEQSGCPSVEVLEQFLKGDLDPTQREQIAAHLEECSTCSDTAKSLSAQTLEVATRSPMSYSTPVGPLEGTTAAAPPEMDHDTSPLQLLDPPQDEKAIGKIGKYDVYGVLGRGGYGVVFRGFDKQLRRVVAIKVLAKDLAASERSRRRFIREARAAACVNDHNVVTIYAVEEHRGMPFLVMEYVAGGTLRDRIRNGPKFGPMDLVRITAQIASALAAAHAQGVIHRDIKPANIMLEDSIERLKITDFGLARVALDNVELTSREMAVGTPAYMAPEQIIGGEIDARSDLFALGCVIHAMVTGHSPFQGRNALEIARRVQDDYPPPLCEIDKSVPRFLSEIAEKLLAKDPEERFQTAAELAALLNHHLTALNQTPTDRLPLALAEPLLVEPPPAPPLPRSDRRRLAIAGAAAALLLVAALMAWQRRDRQEKLPLDPVAVVADEGIVEAAAGGASDSSSSSSAAAGVVELLAKVTVSQQGDSDCSTLGEALKRVAPGGVIEIVDDAVYDESLVIDSDDRWHGVQIVASGGATLQSQGRAPVILVRGVGEFAVRGMRFNARQEQRAVVLEGNCPGARLESLVIQRTPNHSNPGEHWAAIHLHPGARGTQEQPIVIRGVRIADTVVGITVGMRISREPTEWVTIEDCQITGKPSGVLFVMFAGAGHVRVERCVFTGGLWAVSVVALSEAPFEDFRYAHNTVHDCERWMVWDGDDSADHEMDFHANLLLDVSDTHVPLWVSTDSHWFSHNLWRRHSLTQMENASRVARVTEQAPIKSENSGDPDFLVPDLERLRQLVGDGAPLPGHASGEQP